MTRRRPHHLVRRCYPLALTLAILALPGTALALAPATGTQAGGHPASAANPKKQNTKQSSTLCELAGPIVEGLPAIGRLVGANPHICESAGEAVGGLASEAAEAAGNSVLDGLAHWMIDAASTITGFVSREMQQTTTPQLNSSWYQAQFAPMADLGAALGLLVTLIAFASAAIRRSPEALAATLAGIVRAGLGTSLALALVVIGLEISDAVSSAVLKSSPHAFWETVAHAWSAHGFGGFGSSALATVIAMIEVFAALFVWLELIVRNAGIYVAVLFFPVTLAAAIWPALNTWPGRLARLLLLLVILKPVALIVLSLAGNAAAAGLSFGEGVPESVGTILAATVIFALAAFAPWALMYLLAADAESAYMAAGLRTAAGAAVNDQAGRSVRNAGGLRNLSGGSGKGNGDDKRADGGGGGHDGGAGSVGGGHDPSGDGPGTTVGSGPHENATTSRGEDGEALPVGGKTVGAGSIGAAAGLAARPRPEQGHSAPTDRLPAQGSGSREPASTDTDASTGAQAPPSRIGAGTTTPSRARPTAEPASNRGDREATPRLPGRERPATRTDAQTEQGEQQARPPAPPSLPVRAPVIPRARPSASQRPDGGAGEGKE